MWGASEAYANGTMKNWDKIDQLNQITIPTLITSGQYERPPATDHSKEQINNNC